MNTLELVAALSGGTGDNQLNADTISRVETAVDLASPVNALIVMAGRESEAMRDYAIKHTDANPLAILLEDSSRETIGNLHFIKKEFIKPLHIGHFAVVSADYHLGRVEWISKKIYEDYYEVDFYPTKSPYSQQELRKLKLKELIYKLGSEVVLHGLSPEDDKERERRLLSSARYSDENLIQSLFRRWDNSTMLRR